MDEYYVFKLNLEPSILRVYEQNMDQLISEVIPRSFVQVFGNYQPTVYPQLIKFNGISSVDPETITSSDQFQTFEITLRNLIQQYRNVVDRFERTGTVVYSPDFLEMRDDAKLQINNLFLEFPLLKQSLQIDNGRVNTEYHPRIGTGFEFIKRGRKIELFIEEMNTLNVSANFVYDKSNEWIYILSQLDENGEKQARNKL